MFSRPTTGFLEAVAIYPLAPAPKATTAFSGVRAGSVSIAVALTALLNGDASMRLSMGHTT